jgi:hypothetical protein
MASRIAAGLKRLPTAFVTTGDGVSAVERRHPYQRIVRSLVLPKEARHVE